MTRYAGMAELADALDSGSNGRKAVQVQVLLPAPNESRINLMFMRLFLYPAVSCRYNNCEESRQTRNTLTSVMWHYQQIHSA